MVCGVRRESLQYQEDGICHTLTGCLVLEIVCSFIRASSGVGG